MSKNINILKISNYDKFRCIADKCKFTCCEGWDISIDCNTYNKWLKTKDDSLLENIKVNECGNEKEYLINKPTNESCPFLDNIGLCNIVRDRGEKYLSLACRTFPRVENIFENKKEFSLSCACPEVVEIISNVDIEIDMISENHIDLEEELLELKVRENIINIINNKGLKLDNNLILAFQMLLNILNNEDITEDVLLDEFARFNDSEYIRELINVYNEIEIDKYEAIQEINNLFLDIIENYKEVSGLEIILRDISDYVEVIDLYNLTDEWYSFKNKFEKQSVFIKNCIISKVLSSCISDDVEELTFSLEMIILEYLLVRYAVFLRYSMNKNNYINISDIKDYIVCFSRVIGNNTESVIEFLEDGFGDSILEIGYLCFISNF